VSLYEYKESQQIALQDYGFYSLIMAAMRKADSNNSYALATAFPATWDELQERYNAPGGLIGDERE